MTLQKLSKLIALCLCCLLLMPYLVSAEDNHKDKGKMNWKIDQILEDDPEEEQQKTETELEKQVPGLFDEETRQKIDAAQQKNNQSLKDLEDALFTKNFEKKESIEDTTDALFTSDYVVPEASGDHEDEPDESNGFTNILTIIFIGFGILVFGGVYFMFRKLSE